jgi:hypothetical protein
VTSIANDDEPKAATAARIYDYLLGGVHNFPADRAAAEALIQTAPVIIASAKANRAFLRRAVRHLTDQGVRQFLDIGSGIPTAGNVHEVAQVAADARVVYVDIDPVAVAESLDILDGNERATALVGDLRDPVAILDHPDVHRLFDLQEPVGLILAAVLHFASDDTQAYDVVSRLLSALAPGSYLVVSHGCMPEIDGLADDVEEAAGDIYRGRTTSLLRLRDRTGVQRFFAGLDMVDPGLVWAPQWRPDPDDASAFVGDPAESGILVGVARLD